MPGKLHNNRAAEFLIASKRCEIQGLSDFNVISDLISVIGDLVHSLQRERGASNLYVGSIGNNYQAELIAIRQESDSKRSILEKRLDQSIPAIQGMGASSAVLFSRLSLALQAIEEISTLRTKTWDCALDGQALTQAYSAIIRSLLAVVFEAADIARDPKLTEILVGLFNLMQGKELAGQERAVGSLAFASGMAPSQIKTRIEHLIDYQQTCFSTYLQHVDQQAVDTWRALEGSSCCLQISALREHLCGTAKGRLAGEDLARQWFTVQSEKQDKIRELEMACYEALQVQCRLRLEEAEKRLSANEDAVQQFMALREEKEASSIQTFSLLRTTVDNGDGAPGQSRTLMDLVQYQSKRLQEVEQSLDQARTALEERKVLERAKYILMKHRGLEEDEAYQLMRQTAMNQSRRLIDVARSLIEMSDFWKE